MHLVLGTCVTKRVEVDVHYSVHTIPGSFLGKGEAYELDLSKLKEKTLFLLH